MEILQFLLSLLGGGKNLEGLSPVIELLKKNSFNLGDTLKNLDLQTIAPIVKEFMKNAQNKKNPTENSVGYGYALNPIAPFADKDIVYSLNKYFYSID